MFLLKVSISGNIIMLNYFVRKFSLLLYFHFIFLIYHKFYVNKAKKLNQPLLVSIRTMFLGLCSLLYFHK